MVLDRVIHVTTRSKIVLLGVGVAAAVGMSLGLYVARLSHATSEQGVAELDRTLRDSFDRSARMEVETAASLLKSVAERVTRGELSLDVAKKTGADLLRSLRYGKDGYFWADTAEGVNVVLLGRPDEGKSRIGLVDFNGVRSSKASCAARAMAAASPTITSLAKEAGQPCQSGPTH